jgi:17beta-estradiol 17-dehydrogenase / very-long-chain 3-oxoacyl-CoA reductase
LIQKPHDLAKRYGAGSWGVVTGCTSGIGEAYAHDIARRGLNVVLISRTKSKLEKVASDLKASYPDVQTKIVVADFASTNQLEMYKDIAK